MIAAAMDCVDLHCHSRASDGLLAPAEVVRRARAHGVTTLALTDHDETSGLLDAARTAAELGMRFVPGVEISASWNDTVVHVLGLGIDAGEVRLGAGLRALRAERPRRATKMAASLAAAGIPGGLEGAMAYAGNPQLIGRAHFARFLIAMGVARDMKGVFQRYLVPGKPGYVPHEWATITDAVSWIEAAGGIAVLAHPARYAFSRGELRRFLGEFVDAGGKGIEVATSNHSREQCASFAALAREFGLLGSRGSDFHGPGESRAELGTLPQLPDGLAPVWSVL